MPFPKKIDVIVHIGVGRCEELNTYLASSIKIDVEGMEEDAVLGALNTISRDHPLFFIEAGDGQSFIRLSRLFCPLGYLDWETFNSTPTHCFIVHENDIRHIDLKGRSYFYDQLVYGNRHRVHKEMKKNTVVHANSFVFCGEKSGHNILDHSWIKVSGQKNGDGRVVLHVHNEHGLLTRNLARVKTFLHDAVEGFQSAAVIGLTKPALKIVFPRISWPRLRHKLVDVSRSGGGERFGSCR